MRRSSPIQKTVVDTKTYSSACTSLQMRMPSMPSTTTSAPPWILFVFYISILDFRRPPRRLHIPRVLSPTPIIGSGAKRSENTRCAARSRVGPAPGCVRPPQPCQSSHAVSARPVLHVRPSPALSHGPGRARGPAVAGPPQVIEGCRVEACWGPGASRSKRENIEDRNEGGREREREWGRGVEGGKS